MRDWRDKGMKKALSFIVVLSLLLLTVACGSQTETIVIPQTFFSEAELEEIMEEMEVEGETELTVNEDGDFVYEMPKDEYDEMMAELATNIDEMISEILADETMSAVKAIEANDGYDTFDITVDRASFEEGFQGMFILGLGITGMMYQMFDNSTETETVTFNYIDEATNDVYDTVVYPDALEDIQ